MREILTTQRSWIVAIFVVASFLFSVAGAKADTLELVGASSGVGLVVSDADAGYTNLNAAIDPYQGIFDTKSVLIYCVDPDDESTPGTSWSVNVTALGSSNFSNTYLKNATTYGEMAWLITQLQAATQTSTQQELQAAIWEIAEGAPGSTGDFSVTAPSGDANFAANVSTDITNASHHVLTSGFEILSDPLGKEQEYMVVTPEPSTLLLLAVGLLSLAGLASSKKTRGELLNA